MLSPYASYTFSADLGNRLDAFDYQCQVAAIEAEV